ncbi:PH domain-containing protein [Streptomyces sp. ST2-7A]|uniref:PH domain-containing protein n=1 Tax=Streptomyces sp. ST2-7A TaxID=2907214 RepID=UPI001F4066C7|nr:PH domain-containing protein [Streptomyces sp. ST2-7A]MCE7081036.1 PH domain-containing protein [Streptomyces sp. ST2-7A]
MAPTAPTGDEPGTVGGSTPGEEGVPAARRGDAPGADTAPAAPGGSGNGTGASTTRSTPVEEIEKAEKAGRVDEGAPDVARAPMEEDPAGSEPEVVHEGAEPAAGEDPDLPPWQRLNPRMILADALRVLFSLAPGIVALLIVRVEPTPGVLWPLGFIAVWGAIGAAADVLRWITTRYRVTDTYVERRTGLFVRTYRSIRRDRIRSVDADARLLRRLAGLRRVRIGAGQSSMAMESALVLDAVSREDALRLRGRLLEHRSVDLAAGGTGEGDGTRDTAAGEVYAELRPWWVLYNMANVWAFFMAAGLLWGTYWMLTIFGLDPAGWIASWIERAGFGTAATVVLALVAVWLLGVAGLAVNFFNEYAGFRLERVPGENGTVLRTTHGLLRTREVNRDDHRLRGITLSEPLPWRWMHSTEVHVITTGLSMWSAAATILPRVPKPTASRVADAVLATPEDPLRAPLTRHPRAALRRRLGWALGITAILTGAAAWLIVGTGWSAAVWWVTGAVVLPIATGLAVAGHLALGHAVTSSHLVSRYGATNRHTSALRIGAVSGVRIRQSLLQRRLGLATVEFTTAAGWGRYPVVDMAAERAADLAALALPEQVERFRAERATGPGPVARRVGAGKEVGDGGAPGAGTSNVR